LAATDKGKDDDANTVNVSGKDRNFFLEIMHIGNVLLIQMLHLKTQLPAVRLCRKKEKRFLGAQLNWKKRRSFLSPDEQTVWRPNHTSACVARAPKTINQPPGSPTQIPKLVAKVSASVAQTLTYVAQTREGVVQTSTSDIQNKASVSQTTPNVVYVTSSCVDPVPETVDQHPPGSLNQIPEIVAQTTSSVYQEIPWSLIRPLLVSLTFRQLLTSPQEIPAKLPQGIPLNLKLASQKEAWRRKLSMEITKRQLL